MADAHRNVNVDITGDSSSLEAAYDRAGRKAKELDDELDKNNKKNTDRINEWVDHFKKGSDSAVSALAGLSGKSQLIIAAITLGLLGLGPASQVAAGAITFAFGGAFAAIGIIAASESVQVRGEFSKLWQDIKSDIVSVSGPIEQSLMKIPDVWRGVVDQFRPALEAGFQKLAPALDFFIENFSNGFARLAPSIDPLVKGMNSLLMAMGLEAPEIFDALGGAIETLAGTAEDHADMFASFFSVSMGLVEDTAGVMDWFADEWATALAGWEDWWNTLTHGKQEVDLDGSNEKWARYAATIRENGRAALEAAGNIDNMVVSVKGLETALTTLSGVHLNADLAAVKYADQLEKVKSQVRDYGGTLDITTDSGRRNREEVIKLAQASHDLMLKRAEEGATTKELNGLYTVHRDDLLSVANQLNLTEGEAKVLVDRYLKFPKEIYTKISANTSDAQNAVNEFITLNSGRQIPVYLIEKQGMPAKDGGYFGYAAGGPVRGPGGTKTDSIPARISRGEFVVNAAATRRNLPLLEAINSGRGVGGMGNTTIYQINTTVAPTANLSAVGQEIVESIQAFESRSGKTWRSN